MTSNLAILQSDSVENLPHHFLTGSSNLLDNLVVLEDRIAGLSGRSLEGRHHYYALE